MREVSLFGRLVILSIIFSVIQASAAFAESQKIAFVDMQRALAATKAGADAQRKLETEMKKSQGDIDKKKDEYDRLQQTVEKQKSSLTAKALAEKEDQLIGMEKELKRQFEDSRASLRRENARVVGELVNKMRKVVEDLGRAEGYTMIVERGAGGVLYADKNIDITDAVVKRFDETNK